MKIPATPSDTREWTQAAPREAPFAPSTTITGLRRTSRFASYTKADTWYPSWGADDRLYTPFTDGDVHGVHSMSIGVEATTGHAIISGNDPLDLHITEVNTVTASAEPYGGRYPSASLMHDGIWYYGTYCLSETDRGLNWDILGPFVGFRTSPDFGRSWVESPHTPDRPLFAEDARNGGAVRLGSPHFVDHGKNNAAAPGGFAYVVGHGGRVSNGTLSWISGDEIVLGRLEPTPERINNAQSWEWAAGRDKDGNEKWVPDLADAEPVASWPGHMGCVTATWFPALHRYLMCVTDGWPTVKPMTSYVLEAETLFGPWRMAAFMDGFGEQGYFLNFPSKFISATDSTAWLCYSANFTNGYLGTSWESDPVGSRYAMCLQELTVLTAGVTGRSAPLSSDVNPLP